MEHLVGRPSFEIVKPILETHHGVFNFFAAGTQMRGYDGGEDQQMVLVSDRGAESRNWPRNVERRLIGLDYVTLLSQVQMRDTFLHIPMADFDLHGISKEEGLEQAKMLLTLLALPSGILAFSGNGYHYMSPHLVEAEGFNLMIEGLNDEASNFPIVDRRWLRRTKRSGYGQLRVTKGAKKEIQPTVEVIHHIDPLERQLSDQKYHVWRCEV